MRQHPICRGGSALLMVVVVMGVLTVILSVVTMQVVAQHNLVRQRQRQLQADWLVRSGIEFAAARLLESPAPFSDDKAELAPDSKLRVVVEKADADWYNVTVEARVSVTDGRPVARTGSARFRRTDKDGVVRLLTK